MLLFGKVLLVLECQLFIYTMQRQQQELNTKKCIKELNLPTNTAVAVAVADCENRRWVGRGGEGSASYLYVKSFKLSAESTVSVVNGW